MGARPAECNLPGGCALADLVAALRYEPGGFRYLGLCIMGRLSWPDAMDPRPADWLAFIFGRVVRFLEFPLIRPGYPPEGLGPPDTMPSNK
ncbi:MAG: hypothetical protein A2139_05640 [Desulfobacca sp. RBG_16_60_12]|nr:MAG: hypothetical protein A2139_05640 [Desulfobacca sp. RBG_16_60_12]